MDRDPTYQDARSESRPRSLIRILSRQPRRTFQAAVFVLVAIIIAQNLESTSVDVLFWTVSRMPKLFLILLAMFVGAAAWEITRRFLVR